MADVTICKDRETEVRWRRSLPGFALVGGMENEITIRLQDTPETAECTPMKPGRIVLSLRHIPGSDGTVVADFGDFLIHENTAEVPVSLFIPDSVSRGFYKLHIVQYNKDNRPIGVYSAWVAIDSKVEPIPDNYAELSGIRAQLADLYGEDNKMLDGLEFGTGDIVEAADRCLQQWCSTAPRVSNYTGANFPYAELLRNGIIAMLLQSVCHLLGRNEMTYQAEGIAVNLEKRLQYYQGLLSQYNTLWRSGMAQMKNEENVYGFINHLAYV